MKMRVNHSLYLPVFALASLLVIGCTDDDANLKPCPANGIGEKEMSKANEYNCTTPQLCIDISFCVLRGRPVTNTIAPWSCNFVLTNCSKGNKSLEIESIQLLGDERCNFSEPQITSRTIPPLDTSGVVLKVDYDPKKVGADHSKLVIKSNASNFPEFNVPICGFAVEPRFDASAVDAGDPLDSGPATDAINIVCEDRTKLTSSCHN
jgi:hypothetical protein